MTTPSLSLLRPRGRVQSLFDFVQVRDLGDHAASLGRVGPFADLVHPPQSEGAKRLAHRRREPDAAAHLADAKRLLFRGALLRRHGHSPSVAGATGAACSAWPRSFL